MPMIDTIAALFAAGPWQAQLKQELHGLPARGRR